MKTAFDPEQKILLVQVPGDLVSTNADQLRAALATTLNSETAPPWDRLRLELLAAKMVDSVGLNLIVTLVRVAQKFDRKVQVTYTNPNILRTFQFTRLDQHVELKKF